MTRNQDLASKSKDYILCTDSSEDSVFSEEEKKKLDFVVNRHRRPLELLSE